jgi:hypothetical protein
VARARLLVAHGTRLRGSRQPNPPYAGARTSRA